MAGVTRTRIVALLLAGVLVAGCGGGTRLVADPGVPGDLEALARDLWPRFLAAFPARVACIGEVHLAVAWTLEEKAEYDPASRTVTVRAPATAAQLSESIVHELGHHLEFACPSQATVRDRFRKAEGLPAAGGWFDGSRWRDVPSEHWAEAVVAYVLGGRLAHRGTVPVTEPAVAVVEAWARDR